MNVRLTKAQKVRIANSKQLVKIMQDVLLRENSIGRSREHFWIVSLSTASKIINIELVALGSHFQAVVTPSDVYSIAFQKRAAYVIAVHNHPSGNLRPSEADIELTRQLYNIGKYHKVPLHDHLIITEKKFFSFREEGIIKKYSKEINPLEAIEDYGKIMKHEREIEKRKAMEVAKGMLLINIEPKAVSIITGLSVDEVMELR